ncbi:MAG: hypothetical protein KC466_11250 [Myxococcales bacterium]|nr:hypothetical protein [Myxococcales bacterium]
MAAASALALFGARIAWAEPPAPVRAALFEQAILEGIDLSFRGDWDAADRAFARLAVIDSAHPAAAFYPTTTLNWRHAAEPPDPKDGAVVAKALERTVALAEARVDANPRDAEAETYWGGALLALGVQQAREGEWFAGLRTVSRAVGHLERAREIDPDDVEVYYPLGLYKYYASLLPSAVKWLDWLPWIPKGDRDEGLRMLETCRERCTVNRLGADVGLVFIYAAFEKDRADEALVRLRDLRARYPRNAVLQLLEGVLLHHLERWDEVVALTEDAEERVREGTPTYDPKIATLAVLGRAQAYLTMGYLDRADETLTGVRSEQLTTPPGAYAWSRMIRANLLDARGERARAVAIYREIEDLEKPRRVERLAEKAEEYLDAPFVVPTPASKASAKGA